MRSERIAAIKPTTESHDDGRLEGVVLRTAGGRCFVEAGHQIWSCRLRGRLKQGPRLVQALVVAGDRVVFVAQNPDLTPPEGVVEEVLPRRNRISRLAARRSGGHIEQVLMANLDQILVVQSVTAPDPQKGFVDRLLVSAERFSVDGLLVLNKVDLTGPSVASPDHWDYYATIGYRVLRTSAETGEGLEALREVMRGRISMLMGASGVGKSSLLNIIDPSLAIQVTEVGERSGLGRHTTTNTCLFPLPEGGFIADSPGLRGFDPWDVDPLELGNYFPEFAEGARECRYRTCMHNKEPQCGVKALVANRTIPAWRYEAYRDLVRDLLLRRKDEPWLRS